MKLLNPTDDELNATLAEKIAGWRDVSFEEGEDADVESRTIYPWMGMAGWPPDGRKRRLIPQFTKWADSVLPWLNKHSPWRADGGGEHGFMVQVWKGPSPDGNCYATANNRDLCRAAVVAILRANDVDVEFTK